MADRQLITTGRVDPSCRIVSRFGPAVRREAGKPKDLGSIRFGSPLFAKLWFMDAVSLSPAQLK